jgi:methyl-accepting chemotaxis protein
MMPVHSTLGLAFFQAGDISGHDVHLLMIAAMIIAIAVVVAAGGLIATGIFAAKLLHTIDGVAREAKERTGPILDKTNALLAELTPKVYAITTNAEQISYTVREKLEEIAETVSQINRTAQETNARTRVHVVKVDGIVTDALNAAQDVSNTVQEGIRVPLRQVAGIVAGVKAGIEKLVERSPFGRA